MTTQAVIGHTSLSRSWIDGKRYWWLMSPAMPLLGLVSVLGAIAGGPGVLLWLLPFVFYGLAPLLDRLVGEDAVNAPESAVASACVASNRWISGCHRSSADSIS